MTDLFRLRIELTATLDPAMLGQNLSDYRVADGVKVPVQIVRAGGQPIKTHITSEMLHTPPDFSRDGRKAWLCRKLLANHLSENASLEIDIEGTLYGRADGPGAPKVIIKSKLEAGERWGPVIVVNRRGEILFGVVRPDDPFPEFHGQGGNAPALGGMRPKRRRQGDAQLRIREIKQIWFREVTA
jgi:hypothetical protein